MDRWVLTEVINKTFETLDHILNGGVQENRTQLTVSHENQSSLH